MVHASVRLTDALDLCGARGHRIGQGSPRVLARRVEGLAGQVNLRMEFCPRLEYGLTVTPIRWMRRR